MVEDRYSSGALGLIGVADKNSWIDIVNSLKNDWSIVLAVINANICLNDGFR